VRFIAKRVLQLIPVLLIVSFLTFLLLNLLPGGTEQVALTVAGPGAEPEQLEQVKRDLELDESLPQRYLNWLGDAVQGDLGRSYINDTEVSTYIKDRVPVSLQLMLYAQVLALVVAVPLGVLAAYRANSRLDRILSAGAFGLLSVPNFIIGVLLVYLLALSFGWFPATGEVKFRDDPAEHFRSMFLPSLTLSLGLIAIYMRLLRTDMIATLQEDYIGVAKAKGMPTRHVLFRHAFRPSSFSLLTVAGITVGNLIGGALIVEQIFGIHGLGELIVFSIFQRDFLVVQGAVVVICVAFVLINFVIDLLYGFLDPRIRHARALA
jgi:peptide/nickel transport system permease protein